MKWLKLNNGRLINLESVCNICFENNAEVSIFYEKRGPGNRGWFELFNTKEEAHKRMEQLEIICDPYIWEESDI